MTVQRVLKSGDPRGDDYRDAEEWVEDIRSRLVQIRGELEDIGRIEAMMKHDRSCNDVAGTMTLAISHLYSLVVGRRSFSERAKQSDELWADVRKNPGNYLIQDGEFWDWRPLNIFKRGDK